MLITITAEHIEFLRANRIFLNSGGTYPAWLKPGYLNYNTGSRPLVEAYSGQFVGPRFSSVGAFSYVKSYIAPIDISFGRYCAVAEKVQLIPSNHPTDRLSSCGFDYADVAPFNAYERDFSFKADKFPAKMARSPTIVGNDVWIGQDVMIKRGITIGHGAVVAARSIVTKDVPPYAVVAGADAKIKKFRFGEALIERLLKSEWWNYSFKDFVGMNTGDPERFLHNFEDAKERGVIQPMPVAKIDVHKAFREISQSLAKIASATVAGVLTFSEEAGLSIGISVLAA